ncbi:hypothetical protein LT493_07985 [Streptomyces tricolor]|nr:hypothetical protein [Streptomyces tricolor]
MTNIRVSAPRTALPRFEEAEGLGPQDAEFVRDMVAVLAKHGNLNRFGLLVCCTTTSPRGGRGVGGDERRSGPHVVRARGEGGPDEAPQGVAVAVRAARRRWAGRRGRDLPGDPAVHHARPLPGKRGHT